MFKKIIAAIGFAVMATASSAATIDIAEMPTRTGTPSFEFSNVIVTTDGAELAKNSVGFCGVVSIGSNDCSTKTTVDFKSIVSALSFSTSAHNSGDIVTASIYAGATLLSSLVASGDTFFDFTAFSGITSLVVDASASTGFGYVYGSFRFTESADVPLPASGLLLIGGVALMAARRRR